MKPEDLMKPRYKVIADYPHSPYEVGDLIEFSSTGTSFHCTTNEEFDAFREDIVKVENYRSVLHLEKWPHLFKKLGWWEERDLLQLPDYLKNSHMVVGHHRIPYYVVLKVSTYKMSGGGILFGSENRDPMPVSWFVPATEEEYNNQQSVISNNEFAKQHAAVPENK